MIEVTNSHQEVKTMSRSEGDWGLRNGFWLGLSAVFLGAASLNGANVISGVLFVAVIVLTYLTSREIFTDR